MLNTDQQLKIEQTLRSVGDFQVSKQEQLANLEIIEKGLNQLVSEVDIESERMLVESLAQITPEASFITEEETIKNVGNELVWIIDPLDGTTNYLFGHDLFAISIALAYNERVIYGAVYLPKQQVIYHADETGAYHNGIKFISPNRKALANSLIATGFPYYKFNEMSEYLQVLSFLMKETKGLRRMGSAAIDLVYTAQGKFDGFFELNLSPWDVAAGSFIVQQAGGIVSDFSGGNNYIFGNTILAGSSTIYPELFRAIGLFFK